jgi:hypothetical protein
MSWLGVALLRSGNAVEGERLLSQVLASNPDRELRELIDSELYEITALPGYNSMLEQVPESGVLRERPSFTRRFLRASTAPLRLIGSGAGKAVRALFSIF